MPSCSVCRDRTHRAPKGYALMLALILVATVLGGSALVMQNSLRNRDQAKRERLSLLLDSGLASAEQLAASLVIQAATLGLATSEQTIDLRDVKIDVQVRQEDGAEPRRYVATARASRGKAVRGKQWSYQVKPMPPPPEIDGGVDTHGVDGSSPSAEPRFELIRL